MSISKSNSIFTFAEAIAGKFSNLEQAQKSPSQFAHINIYFRPLPWNIFKGPGFYSEQSYDYLPWSPYRQGIHRLFIKGELIIMDNFQIDQPERVAGAGFRKELIDSLNHHTFNPRYGCSMYFKELSPNHYFGEVEPGKKCLINRNGQATYLASKVEIKANSWISIDQGFDLKSNKLIWGSENGPIQCKKVLNFGDGLHKEWIKSKTSQAL